MRIVVTGKAGQVVTALRERGARAGHDVIALGRPELDLAEPDTVWRSLAARKPDVVVSAAAYTAVDRAETERDLAFMINSAGASAVASATAALGVPLIHISTDYVFDGKSERPYRETDATGPSGVYGASKLAGEAAVLAACGNTAILRVAWVYSPFGANFAKTMLHLAGERDRVSVIADQLGNPTSALDIADGVLMVATNLLTRDSESLRGVFHMTARGEASWAGFAKAIFTASARHGGPCAEVFSIPTANYPTLATRPANSRLDCSLIEQVHGVVLPHWHNGLEVVIDRLQNANA
jgi:dTDP-4-dehydrorhamnose reductase